MIRGGGGGSEIRFQVEPWFYVCGNGQRRKTQPGCLCLFLSNLFLCQWVDLGKKVFLKQPWVKFVPGFRVGSPPRKYRGSPGCPILELFSEKKIYPARTWLPSPCRERVCWGGVPPQSGWCQWCVKCGRLGLWNRVTPRCLMKLDSEGTGAAIGVGKQTGSPGLSLTFLSRLRELLDWRKWPPQLHRHLRTLVCSFMCLLILWNWWMGQLQTPVCPWCTLVWCAVGVEGPFWTPCPHTALSSTHSSCGPAFVKSFCSSGNVFADCVPHSHVS